MTINTIEATYTQSTMPVTHNSKTAVSPHKKSLVTFKAIDSFRQPKLVDPQTLEMATQSMLAALLKLPNRAVRITMVMHTNNLKLKILMPTTHTKQLAQFRTFFQEAGIEIASIQDSLRSADLSHMDLSKAILYKENLRHANLSGTNLSGADLNGVDLRKANLNGANLSKVCMMNANLGGARLSQANLSNATLYGADFSGADLSHADLSRAKLSRANLSKSNLDSATVIKANISQADLCGANLRGAEMHKTLNLQTAVCDPNTRWY